jgi:hypothetical protein
MRGARNTNGGTEKIEDPDEVARLQRRAVRVLVESLIAGAAATALFVALP